jgi:hypothetical protein
MFKAWIPIIIGCSAAIWCAAGSAGDAQPSGAAPQPTGASEQPPPTPPTALPPAPRDGRATATDPASGRVRFDFAGLGLTQERTDDAYLLDIELRGIPAEQVLIRPLGGGLLLAVRRTAETRRDETIAEGRGYRRSWSYASGQRVKRLPAPPDADIAAMTRRETPGGIRVEIPRRASNLGGRPVPGQPPVPPPPGIAVPGQ